MTKKDDKELTSPNQAFLIYQDDNGVARVNVRFEGEDVWLMVEQMMERFDALQQDVSYRINQIYAEGEQDKELTHKEYLLVQREGTRSVKRQMSHYNLDMIIAVGYHVKSQVATRFRQWDTTRLREFLQKEFTLDDNRLKGSGIDTSGSCCNASATFVAVNVTCTSSSSPTLTMSRRPILPVSSFQQYRTNYTMRLISIRQQR